MAKRFCNIIKWLLVLLVLALLIFVALHEEIDPIEFVEVWGY